MTTGLTSTQIGGIAETIVAAQLMLSSRGRLSPFLPLADDDGLDLLLFDKKTARVLPIQVKSWLAKPDQRCSTVQFDVRRRTFRRNADAFLIAVVMDQTAAALRSAWLIPMLRLESVARPKAETLTLTPSLRDRSQDRYAPYRHPSLATLTGRLLAHLDAEDAATDGATSGVIPPRPVL